MLPHSPGVYRFLDSEGTVIYVGKAKDLKNRVSQYFRPNGLNRKTQVMVSRIADIQHTVVGSEADAFLLENNLINSISRVTTSCSRTARPIRGYACAASLSRG